MDMGNTLLDFHKGPSDEQKDMMGLSYMSNYLKSLRYDVSVDTLKKYFLDVLYTQFHLREEALIEIEVEKILRTFLSLNELEMEALIRCFYLPYKAHVVLHDGANDLLEKLHLSDKIVGIISNCFLPSFVYKEIFADVGLDQWIDSYTFSYDYKIRKPRAELYNEAFKQYDVLKTDMIMIGDGYKPDILGTSALGVDAIWYNHKREVVNEKARHLVLEIHSLKDLL